MAGTTHEVKPGECIATIAAQYGVPWKTVWEAPENAALRKTRKDPNVLAPGDKVTVPKAKPRQSPIETGKAHRFVIHRERIKVHLRLTANREPLKDEPYRIEFGEHEIEGKTSGEGMLEAEVPSDQKDVVLTLPRRQQTYTLLLGDIDPIDTIRGAQTRLHNLGLYRGELDGELGDETTAAIEFFQRIQKLSVTGKYDAATQKALAEFYGF